MRPDILPPPPRFPGPLPPLFITSIVSTIHASVYLCYPSFLHVKSDKAEKPDSWLQRSLVPEVGHTVNLRLGWLKDMPSS